MEVEEVEVGKGYKALRIIAFVFKGFAFVALGPGLWSTWGRSAPSPGMVFGGFAMAAYGMIHFVALYAFDELIYVFLDIEKNTRLTARMLARKEAPQS